MLGHCDGHEGRRQRKDQGHQKQVRQEDDPLHRTEVSPGAIPLPLPCSAALLLGTIRAPGGGGHHGFEMRLEKLASSRMLLAGFVLFCFNLRLGRG